MRSFGGALGGRPFLSWGIVGVVAATAIALGLAAVHGLSLAVQAGVVALSLAAFLAVALGTKRLTGVESLTYYHHEIAVLVMAALLVVAVEEPVLAHLDLTALGLGTFLACGRMGCLTVGCCHGRPAARGIVYKDGRRARALPRHLVGRPLVPVQALDGVTALLLVASGATLLATSEPGTALALYVSVYAAVRFGLEEFRGDWRRRYIAGLSEAQWTSLVLVVFAVAGEHSGVLPGPAASVALLVIGTELVLVVRRRRSPRALLDPRHVAELVAACRPAPSQTGPPPVTVTSQGVLVSRSAVGDASHVTISRRDPLSAREADELTAAVAAVCLAGERYGVVRGPAGIVHVIANKPHRSFRTV